MNETGQDVPFILNWSDGGPVLEGNVIEPAGAEISSEGYLAHRAAGLARDLKQSVRGVAGMAKRGVLSLFR